jgi:TorA maturation chaperone TorD|tara:strand:- start:167 stop:835 length:669 start_codon:yes stop_codon:yes gene_type:complete
LGSSEDVAQSGLNPPNRIKTSEQLGVSDVDLQRAHMYGLLSRLLGKPLSDDTLVSLRTLKSEFRDSETELEKALASLGIIACRTVRAVAEEEYTLLFYGMGSGGELNPYASHYLTGFVYEKPLANLRRDMAALGIVASGISSEPEDHIAYLCEIMHGLITGEFGEIADLETQRKMYVNHMAPWVGQFFSDLEGAEAATLYMLVGSIGRHFMAIEADAFEIPA